MDGYVGTGGFTGGGEVGDFRRAAAERLRHSLVSAILDIYQISNYYLELWFRIDKSTSDERAFPTMSGWI